MIDVDEKELIRRDYFEFVGKSLAELLIRECSLEPIWA